MRLSKFYLVLLIISIGVFLYSCESVTNSIPQEDGLMTQEMTLDNSSKTKVEACHVDDEGNFNLISIADPALQAHYDHGDGVPGGDVPGMEGFVFDETCNPELVVAEITACFEDVIERSFIDKSIVENISGWSLDSETSSNYTISAPYNNDKLVLGTYLATFGAEKKYRCLLTQPLPNGFRVTFNTLETYPESMFQENIDYLSYLLSL